MNIACSLGMILEGPVAFDGKDYYFSEGGGYYIERIASQFEKVVVFAHVLKQDDPYYENVALYKFSSPNLSFVELPMWRKGISKLVGKAFQMLQVTRVLYSGLSQLDVAHVFLPGYSGAIASIILRLTRKKYSVYLASDWPEEAAVLFPFSGLSKLLFLPIYRFILELLQNQAALSSTFTLTAGKLLCEKYQHSTNYAEETVPRLYWPEISMFDRHDTCCSQTITLLFVGYLIERKGARYFIEGISLLQKMTSTKITGVVVGEGEERQFLTELVESLDLTESIRFTGYLPNGPQLFSEFQDADIFVCPSFSGEGFPRVLYEAMSQGLPIIATDICGISDKLSPSENALFVEPKDAAVIAQSAHLLITDTGLRRTLIDNGKYFMTKLMKDMDGGRQYARLFSKYCEMSE